VIKGEMGAMMKSSMTGFMGAALVLVAGTIAVGQERPDEAKKSPRLLWVRSKYNGSAKEKLVESEKLTIAEYTKRGVDVVELKTADLEKWREGEGKDYAKAHKYLQYVAYGKGLMVQAVGGLSVFEITSDMEENFGKKAGDYIQGWGIALKGCESNFMLNFEGGEEPRAIPMALMEGDPWAIPQSIEARSCESSGKEPDFMAMMSKGKPFMGVMLEGKKVSSVMPSSPAESAGLAVGDELVSVGGKEIESLGDLAVLMSEKKPGDEVEIAYERDTKRTKKTFKLADRATWRRRIHRMESRRCAGGQGHRSVTCDWRTSRKVILLDFGRRGAGLA
jgi:hypothetical protein